MTDPGERLNAFDRWLAADDAEVRKDEREQVAREIEAAADERDPHPNVFANAGAQDQRVGLLNGLDLAARIARGGAS